VLSFPSIEPFFGMRHPSSLPAASLKHKKAWSELPQQFTPCLSYIRAGIFTTCSLFSRLNYRKFHYLKQGKFQIPGTKFQIMIKFQCSNQAGVWQLDNWCLFVIWDLSFGNLSQFFPEALDFRKGYKFPG
jgi:hypothetical protein